MSPFSFDYVIIIILITISKERRKKTNNRDAEDFCYKKFNISEYCYGIGYSK